MGIRIISERTGDVPYYLNPGCGKQCGKSGFLVSGGDKAAALYHVLGSEHDPYLYPAQIIQPFNSELYWFYDEAAAADL